MNNETAIKILSKRNYMCGECPFSGPDCKGCRLADALDLAIGALDTDDEPKTSRQERALEIIDALKADRLIGNKQRGILRRAILDNTPEVPSNMTLIPTAVLDELTNISAGGLGRWKVDGALIACDSCGQILIKASKLYRYCPNCGALMTNSINYETE